ncbi:MAG TPA: SCO family protein [Vicinamibacterales bacterium]|nr:SCO family protein [Vicinamibacterales bacterium]
MSGSRVVVLALTVVLAVAVAALLFVRNTGKPDERTYALHGQVQSITSDRQEALVKHGEVKGLMPAMTMPYRFKTKSDLDALKPGDLIDGTLVIVSNDAFLTDVKKTGEAPIEKAPAESLVTGSTLDKAAELLKPGDTVPDGAFVNQAGQRQTFKDFRGSTVVLTFIYTRCPLPTFCPMMDRHFVSIQERLNADPTLKHVHLVTVSFDPARDTPAVLRAHAKELEADLRRWTFLTGDVKAIDQFAGRFGVYVVRNPNDERDITHNLRTAIIGPDGTVKKIYTGNEWTPEDILMDLKPVANAD